MSELDALGPPQWHGQRGRLEVWYATFTDSATGLGGWVHLETVAPRDGSAPYVHGWTALFPADGPPVVERFGPEPVQPAGTEAWCTVGLPTDPVWAVVAPPAAAGGGRPEPGVARLQGVAGGLAWDLRVVDPSPPLYTFPRAVWERHLLPASQVVPLPDAAVTGTVTIDGESRAVSGPGALARIYGHGNAQRWGWLHAALGDGAVLEIVTATARRPGLRRLPPLALVQLRRPGDPDWPANPLLAALRFRTTLRADGGGFTVAGTAGGHRLTVDVELPADQRVALRYTDPDGALATCTNSERAHATVTLTGPEGEQRWTLDATAHAEVGTRR